MGEPTIYKPSIYKGNGVYNTGAGGGGGVDYKYIYPFFRATANLTIELDEAISNENKSIIFDISSKISSSVIQFLLLKDSSNSTKGIFARSAGGWTFSNGTGNVGGAFGYNTGTERLVMYNNAATAMWNATLPSSNTNAPYSQFDIKKIEINTNASLARFAITNDNLLWNTNNTDCIIDLRPYKKGSDIGVIDVVSGNIYLATSGECY